VQLPEPDFALAERLFEILDRSTRDVAGFTRASYGEGEQFAHQLIERKARGLELAISKDPAGNLMPRCQGATPRSRLS
jgi:N-carbamoyl-L-amino-acid hydrolase